MSREFCRGVLETLIPRVFKKFLPKKVRAHFSFPIHCETLGVGGRGGQRRKDLQIKTLENHVRDAFRSGGSSRGMSGH